MSHFLIYAVRMQDAGICDLWVSLGSDKTRTRLMHVSPGAGTPPELAARYPTRTFELCGTDRVLERLQDDMSYSDIGPTAEKVQAAIDAHPLLRDDLAAWFADHLLLSMPTDDEVDAEAVNVSEADVEQTRQYVKGLMHGIDVLQARKAMKTA
jgi:hypothetical protein